MEKFKIEIAKDFSPILGGRWKRLGQYSGEEFYESILKPKFEEALKNDSKLEIYLDGTKGYGSSFLDQSFGELKRKFGESKVEDKIIFQTDFFQSIVEYINSNIWK